MLSPVLVTPPAEPSAVPLDELKRQLHVDTDDDDILIDSLGIAATKYLDGWTGILGGVCLVRQTWSESFDGFPCGEPYKCSRSNTMQNVLRLRLFPVIEIVSVKYYDSAGVLQTDAGSNYRIQTDALGAFVANIPGAASPWPSSTQSRTDAVIVEYKAGYGEAADVPEPIRTAICMKVARMYSMSRLSVSSAGGIVRSETVDGIGSQTFGSGAEAVQIMQRNTEEEEYLLGPYRRSFFA